MAKEVKRTPKVRLLADRVLVRIIQVEERTTLSGIIIPTTGLDPEKMVKRGIVVRMSPSVQKFMEADKTMQDDMLEVGEEVIFSQHAGSDISFGMDEFKILRITDIMAVDEEGDED